MVGLSTTEAEYVALCTATQEAVWLRRLLSDIEPHKKRRLLSDIELPPKRPTIIKEDNQGTIKNPISHSRTDVKFHFVHEALNDGFIELVYCPTGQKVADIMTKPLSCDRFETLRLKMGLKILSSVN